MYFEISEPYINCNLFLELELHFWHLLILTRSLLCFDGR